MNLIPLKLALLQKYNNGDVIKHENGQTFHAEHDKPWYAVGRRIRHPFFDVRFIVSNDVCTGGRRVSTKIFLLH